MTSKTAVTTFSAHGDDCSTDNSAAITETTPSKTSTDSLNSNVTLVPQDKTATEQEPTALGKNTHNKTVNSTHDTDEKNPSEIICVVAVSILELHANRPLHYIDFMFKKLFTIPLFWGGGRKHNIDTATFDTHPLLVLFLRTGLTSFLLLAVLITPFQSFMSMIETSSL